MARAIIIALVMSAFVACGGAPAPTRSNTQAYSVISEQANPAAGTSTLLIRVTGPATQANVKSAAEAAISGRKGGFAHVIVKSYVEGMTASDPPFAISRLENGAVTHRFNSTTETQKIP